MMSDSEIDVAATDFDRVSETLGAEWSGSYSLSGYLVLRGQSFPARWVTPRDADASPDVRRCDRCRRPRDNGHESLCPICLLGHRAP